MFKTRKKHYILALVFLLLVVAIYLQFFKGTKFNQEIWLRAATYYKDGFPRLEMADDLIDTQRLAGLTKEQVLDLLGHPRDHGYFTEYDLVYWLGDERSLFGIDSEWLAIKIGSDGKVFEYKIVRD